ncbi:MAG: ABC transporter ATP-binding protein, partial [Panacibacter sp.]
MNLIFLGGQGTDQLAKSSGSPVVQRINDELVNIIQSGGVQGKVNALLIICAIIFGATFFKNLFIYLSFYILNPIKNTIVNTLRLEIYDKILRLPIGYFTEKRKGDLMSRTTNDLAEVESSVVGVLEGWITYPLQIIAYLAVLLVLSPQLTIFVLIFIPVMGFIIGRITRSLKKQSLEVAEKSGESVSILDETLGGLRVIKAFNVENILRGKFFAINTALLKARNHISYRRDMASPMSEFLGVTMFCGILYFGGRLVLGQSINLAPSAFLTYLAMFYNIINPAKSLSTSFSNVQKGSSAMQRIDEVLNAPVTVDENPNGKKVSSFNESIEFRNVSFSYEDFSILKNINLTIKKGQTVALVGSSGAGKSTLADLVPRFHDVTSGELLIDGINIKDYSLRELRQLMGIVTQEPILFNDTIANNIAL